LNKAVYEVEWWQPQEESWTGIRIDYGSKAAAISHAERMTAHMSRFGTPYRAVKVKREVLWQGLPAPGTANARPPQAAPGSPEANKKA
jgi:hypothetical protein